MTPLIGGVFAARAFANGMFSEAAGTPITSLSSWLRLARDPRGGPHIGLMARISKRDYDDFPGLNKYRSELRGNFQLLGWGQQSFWYHWRLVVPPDWFNLGAGSEVIVGQMHEVNAGNVGRRPTFAWEITEDRLHAVWSRDSVTGGESRFSTPVQAGQAFDLAVRVRWADGTNAPAELGFAETYVDGRLVDSFSGLNTWAGTDITEPNPPYIKCGVYQPGPAFGWWAGRAAEMFYLACGCYPGDASLAAIHARTDQLLALNAGSPVGLL